MSNAIVQALEDAARKIVTAVEDAARSAGHFVEDTGTRLRAAARDLSEHDGNAAAELERAAKHGDETPTIHGSGSAATRPASSGSGGPDVVAETERAAALGRDVHRGLQTRLADPRTRDQFPPGYDPFHGDTPGKYIADHTTPRRWDAGGRPDWDYAREAPNHGALGDEERTHLPVGHRIDRYGNPYGRFTSPEGTSYPGRGLPADNLAKEYHQYEVVKPLPVWRAPVLPAFGEQGFGVQYRLNGRVKWYVDHGYLRELKP